MAQQAYYLGKDAKIYYRVGGQEGGGSWLELVNVTDVTMNLSKGEANVTTRGNAGFRATVGTLKDGSVTFEMIWNPSDAGFAAIKNAYFDDEMIGLRVLDKEDGQGLQADFSITDFSRSEALEEAIKVSVTAKPTYSTIPPSWVGA